MTAVVVDVHDGWAVFECRYLSEESMAKLEAVHNTGANERGRNQHQGTARQLSNDTSVEDHAGAFIPTTPGGRAGSVDVPLSGEKPRGSTTEVATGTGRLQRASMMLYEIPAAWPRPGILPRTLPTPPEQTKVLVTAVGLARIELATSSLSGMRSNRLSYSPQASFEATRSRWSAL